MSVLKYLDGALQDENPIRLRPYRRSQYPPHRLYARIVIYTEGNKAVRDSLRHALKRPD